MKKDMKIEAKKRDQALDLFEQHRADLLEYAKVVAVRLAMNNGTVTSPEVVDELYESGWAYILDHIDHRFMGGVFRSGTGWERVGFKNLGSHKQPISVWKLKK